MRLLEISSERSQSTEGTLATLLQFLLGKADMPEIGDKSVKQVRVPIETILGLMKNAGVPFSYQDLDAAVKKSSMVKNLIKSMDPQSLVIKAEPSDMNTDIKPGDETDIAKMASRASKKRM